MGCRSQLCPLVMGFARSSRAPVQTPSLNPSPGRSFSFGPILLRGDRPSAERTAGDTGSGGPLHSGTNLAGSNGVYAPHLYPNVSLLWGKFPEASGRPGGTGNYGALTPPESYGISWGMPERIALRCIPPPPRLLRDLRGDLLGAPHLPPRTVAGQRAPMLSTGCGALIRDLCVG